MPPCAKIGLFLIAAAICGLPAPAAAASATVEVSSLFQANRGWTTRLEDGQTLLVRNAEAITKQLRFTPEYGDDIVRIVYRPVEGGAARLFLQARYPVALDGAPGAWHTLVARVRGARYDEAATKTEHAFIVDVVRDGERVVTNQVFTAQVAESEFTWENGEGPTTVVATVPGFAIREFDVRRANFDALTVPETSGGPNNLGELTDFVAMGRGLFTGLGCIECHAIAPDDPAVKTGPNQYGLFRFQPREREIMDAEGHRFLVKADRAYLHHSVRTPPAERAIAEPGRVSGVPVGEPYLPVMPPYPAEVISDSQLEAIGAFLATLNPPADQGPVEWWVAQSGPENYDVLQDRLQLLVDTRVRLQRGPMAGVSGRAVHVGLPNGLNYSFDPRVLAIAKIWQGGFLNMAGEWQNRGGHGLAPGYQAREISLGTVGVLFAPLNTAGEPIDFSFKDAIFEDIPTRLESLYSDIDPLVRNAAVDAGFLGYERDSRDATAAPVFNYRIGPNTLGVATDLAIDGAVTITVSGHRAAPQAWRVNTAVLTGVAASAGTLADGVLTVPAGDAPVRVTARLAVGDSPWRPAPSTFDATRQPLETAPATAILPAGYTIEDYLPPRDNYGRELLFEALGVALAPDGTMVVATRGAGIWRLVAGEWRLFAEGLFDSLGVQVEDEHGLVVVAGQKAELTRISDTNGDGLADRYDTMTDAFSYHGNYHAYLHGPIRDAHGDYFITLNLAHNTDDGYYNAGGKYMGTAGGYRGWAIRVPHAGGGFEPWANGLRSPAGLGLAPDGRLWYADNQGEYVATSKIFVLHPGAFYGHPAGLVDLPGMTPESPEIQWEAVSAKREKPVILLPQTRLANSPGNLAWDTTGGKFGPYGGQMFLGDQTQSVLMRVSTETVAGQEQGAVVRFGRDLESGVMRPVFLPDGSLLLGQTGRGWQAKGGRVASLQRIRWDGTTIAPAIATVAARADGFDVRLTVPVPADLTTDALAAALRIRSWTYRDAPDYGSPELDEHDEAVTALALGSDRRSVRITLATTVQPVVHPQQTARVYRLTLDGARCFGPAAAQEPGLEAFYTLYAFPAE